MSEKLSYQPKKEGTAARIFRRSINDSFPTAVATGAGAILFPAFALPIIVGGLAIDTISTARIIADESRPKRRLA